MKKRLLLFLSIILSFSAFAHDVEIDGIFYKLNKIDKTATVTYEGADYYTEVEYSGDIIIPDSINYEGENYVVTEIDALAFYHCTIYSVVIPKTVKYIGHNAFLQTYLLKHKDNWEDNVLYIGDCLIAADTTDLKGDYIVKEGTRLIASGAFAYCSKLTSVTMPNSVTSISDGIFSGCKSLTSVSLPNNIDRIGDCMFCRCGSLTSVDIPNSVKRIGDSAFDRCYNLKSLTIPNNVTSIGSFAFSECNSLDSITIPNSVTYIDVCAFKDCSELRNVVLSSNLGAIPGDMFESCAKLDSLDIPNSVKSIGESAFMGCESLKSIVIPDSVRYIADQTFAGCTNLVSVTIPYGVDSIGWAAFEECASLTSVYIPSSVKHIAESAFGECSSLSNLKISDGVTTILDGAFSECTSLESVIIPNSVTFLGACSFEECISLKSVKLSENLTSIEYSTFGYCDSLYSVVIPNKVTYIDERAFYGCNNLKEVYIPNSVTSIGERAFDDCWELESITVPRSVTYIGKYAFTCSDDKFKEIILYSSQVPESESILYTKLYSEVILKVPCDMIEDYKAHHDFGKFENIVCIQADEVESGNVDVVIEPSDRSMKITWQKVEDAERYVINIINNDSLISSFTFNKEGYLLSRNLIINGDSGFTFNVNGLEPGNNYSCEVKVVDIAGNEYEIFNGNFTTNENEPIVPDVPTKITETLIDVQISVSDRLIKSSHADMEIYNLLGENVTAQNGSLLPGIYIVKVNERSVKVVVR